MIKERAYYVSERSGSDENEGSIEKPLRSLAAAGRLDLKPGDELLLECGSIFEGQSLQLLNCRGSRAKPVRIGSYGTGPRPVIAANGKGLWYQDYQTGLDSPYHVWRGYVSSAVLLYDCEYIHLTGIEITNEPQVPGERYSQADKMSRTGVAVVAQNGGTLHQIELSKLYIHDVKGNIYDKHLNNGGIYCTALKPEKADNPIARYDGLYIHHCVVENCSRWGIAAGYSYTHPFFATKCLDESIVERYGHANVVLEHNYVKGIGGDGITPMYCLRPLIQYNVAEDVAMEMNDTVYKLAGERQGKTAAAIWPWKCKGALFQYNEAYHTFENQDGQAWDADSGDGTVYQYNYSYNNGGGCVMFCEPESVHNTFRYNISMLDQGGVINPAHNSDAHIYGNVFVMAPGVPFIRDNMSGGHMLVEHNIIYNSGEKAVLGDWHHQTELARYHHNLYYNFLDFPPEDTEAIVREKGEAVLQEPLGGPRQTSGQVHSRDRFSGFLPAKSEKEVDHIFQMNVHRESVNDKLAEPLWPAQKEREEST